MERSADLRDFLRSRRARLEPPDVGLPWRDTAGRRVAGLRREEVALAAGVSVDYYTRLEQGRAGNVSDQVLDALADALRLDDLERAHLHTLARPAAQPGAPVRSVPPPKASATVRAMVDALDPTPAVLHGPMLEVLAINRMGAILLDDFAAMPPTERNMAQWTFLNPRAREVYPEWETIAAQMVAILRRSAAVTGNSAALAALVGELSVRSEQFSRWWADHRLFQHTHGPKRFHHRLVGDIDLQYQSLLLPQAPGQSLIVYTAAAGSPAADKLALLSGWNPEPTRSEKAPKGADTRPPS